MHTMQPCGESALHAVRLAVSFEYSSNGEFRPRCRCPFKIISTMLCVWLNLSYSANNFSETSAVILLLGPHRTCDEANAGLGGAAPKSGQHNLSVVGSMTLPYLSK